MDNFEQLLQQCEVLKQRIKDLQIMEVEETQKSVQKIQLQMLGERLTEVGRQLNRITLYKKR